MPMKFQPVTPQLRRIRSQGAKRRWQRLTAEERSDYARMMARELWSQMSREERMAKCARMRSFKRKP